MPAAGVCTTAAPCRLLTPPGPRPTAHPPTSLTHLQHALHRVHNRLGLRLHLNVYVVAHALHASHRHPAEQRGRARCQRAGGAAAGLGGAARFAPACVRRRALWAAKAGLAEGPGGAAAQRLRARAHRSVSGMRYTLKVVSVTSPTVRLQPSTDTKPLGRMYLIQEGSASCREGGRRRQGGGGGACSQDLGTNNGGACTAGGQLARSQAHERCMHTEVGAWVGRGQCLHTHMVSTPHASRLPAMP